MGLNVDPSSISVSDPLRRDSLYRSFSGEMSPAFEKVIQVLQALDVQLIVKPAAGLSSSKR
jgi:DNA-binding phage protein